MTETLIHKELPAEEVLNALWLEPFRQWQVEPPEFFLERRHILDLPLCLTNRPEEMFGENPFFHVTTDYVLPALTQGLPLLPPMSHPDAGIVTHRKAGLHLTEAILTAFRAKPASSQAFIYAGPLIDAEQVILEDALAQSPSHTHAALSICFERPTIEGDYRLQPEWLQALELLEDNGWIDPDGYPKLQQFLTQKLDQIFHFGLIREGWYKYLKEVFNGTTGLPLFDSDAASGLLHNALFNWEQCLKYNQVFRRQHLGQGHALVLEISPQRLFQHFRQQVGGMPVMFSKRDPHTILPIPYLPAEAVTRIYHIKPDNLGLLTSQALTRANITVQSTADIPHYLWLAGKNATEIGNVANINPEAPLCHTRYQALSPGELKDMWIKSLTARKVLPVTNFLVDNEDALMLLGQNIGPNPAAINDLIPLLTQS